MTRVILLLDSKREYLFVSVGIVGARSILLNYSHLCFLFSLVRAIICSYAIPLTVALVAFILRWIADATCSPYSHVCRKSSDLFSHIYAVVIIFLLIVGATKAKQVKDFVNKIKTVLETMNGNGGGKQKRD